MCVAGTNQSGSSVDSSLLRGSHPGIVYTNTIIVHTNSRHYYYCTWNSSRYSESSEQGLALLLFYTILHTKVFVT